MRTRVWKLGKGRSCNVHLDLTDHTTLHHLNCALKLVLICGPHPVYVMVTYMPKEPFNSNPPPSETVRNTKFVI